MDFSFTPEQEEWRKEVRSFLQDVLPPRSERIPEDQRARGFSRQFALELGKKGWLGLTWPREYGGQERSQFDRLILTEELLQCAAPCAAFWVSERQVGPAILAHGSEELKGYFLPSIAKGELTICIGFSEPQAGSDLASLQTRAVDRGEFFAITGQKLWTSLAHKADYCYLVARTDETAARHAGLSEFLVDMHADGITIHTITDVVGDDDLNEVFYDNVHVPRKMLVGQENRGWYQIVSQLDCERTGMEYLMVNVALFDDLLDYARHGKLAISTWPNSKLAELVVSFEIGRLLVYRAVWLQDKGLPFKAEAAVAKLYCTEWEQRLSNVAMELLGLHAQLMPGTKTALLSGRAARSYLFSRSYTVAAGTSEIMRNIVGNTMLRGG